MKLATLSAGLVFLATLAYGQNTPEWPCSEELAKAEGDNRRVRVNVSVTEAMAQKRILPDVSDLKHTKTTSDVVLKVLIGKDGTVRCAAPVQGDPSLFQRSVDAAKQWRFQPYLLSGQPIIVETTIEFAYKKGKVAAR
jgi:periplasmic protein TonB